MIVVTGSTGYVGGLVAEELARREQPMRLLVRDPARAPRLPGAEVVRGDYGDPEALGRALRAGDVVFMVSLHEGPERRVPLHRSFVETAARVGVGRIVYLSFLNADRDATFLHARSHGATEEMLGASGVPFTAVRNGMYADEIPGWFDPDGMAREPGGTGRLSFSYRPELAEAIAVLLTEPGRDRPVYDITASEAVSLAELAQIASEVTGDHYRWEPIDDDAWEQRWREQGRPDWAIEAGRTSYEALRGGELEVASNDFRALTGRDPSTVAAIVGRLSDEMPLASRSAAG